MCEKCGEIYADMSGECPTCRKKSQQTFMIWVLAGLLVVAIAGTIAYRIIAG